MKQNIVIIVLALALAVCSYMLGWNNVTLRDEAAREAQAHLVLSLAIYQQLDRGEYQRAKSNLGIVVLGETRMYEHQFGVPTGTNVFAKKFVTAQTIAAQIESTLIPVSSALTNIPHAPDAKITIEKQ